MIKTLKTVIIKIYLSGLLEALDERQPSLKRMAAASNFLIINIVVLYYMGLPFIGWQIGLTGACVILLITSANFIILSIYNFIEMRRIRKEITRLINKQNELRAKMAAKNEHLL